MISLFPFPAGFSSCTELMMNCWKNPILTKDTFNHCIPQFNNSAVAVEECDDPKGIAVDDPKCTSKTTTTTVKSQQPAQRNYLFEQMSSTGAIVARYIDDMVKALVPILATGFAFATLLGFVWLLLLRMFAGVIVWTTVLGTLVTLVIVTLFCFKEAGLLTTYLATAGVANTEAIDALTNTVDLGESGANPDTMKYIGYIMSVITVGFFVMIIALRQKIRVAIAVLKEAAKAVAAMPIIVLFPLTTTIATLSLMLYFIFGCALLRSMEGDAIQSALADLTSVNMTNILPSTAGNSTGNSTGMFPGASAFADMSYKDYLLAYHFFGFLWTNQFFQGIGIMTISGSIAQWYFDSGDKDENTKSDSKNVPKALYRTLRYHLGSVAFGSLIIAIVQFLRACLMYLDKQTKNLQESNFALKVAMKVVACCLWCLEKCMKYISKNAYIVVAVTGRSFCSSGLTALKLLLTNAAQVAATGLVCTFVMLLGKVVICGSCVVVGYLWLGTMDTLSSVAFPLVCVALLSYFSACSFLEVYEMAIDTILICFFLNKECAGESIKKVINMEEKEFSKKDEKAGGDEGKPVKSTKKTEII
jgi:choline transporter-like protein 2/4/5